MVSTSNIDISHREPVCCIQTDTCTSTDGWGGVRRDQKTGERWTPEEAYGYPFVSKL